MSAINKLKINDVTYDIEVAHIDTSPTENSDNPVKSGGVKTAMDRKKNTQSAVSDPTASGTEIAFIDSISQNAQGVITPTKKTVRSATGSQSGVVTLSDAYATSGGAAVNSVGASSKAVNDLYNDAVSTAEAKKAYHLNFYIDTDGDLCQAD